MVQHKSVTPPPTLNKMKTQNPSTKPIPEQQQSRFTPFSLSL